MRPSIRWFAILAAGLVISLAGVAQAQPAPGRQSWGKPGVSFLQYRTDAVECAWLAGSATPVSVPPVDQMFAMEGQDVFEVTESAKRGQHRIRNNVADQLAPALETCLRRRGYRPFRLTDDQNAQLKGLKRGSASRHRYLYGLAIDPEVLKGQGL
ncbi:hypothetical protein [Caulobacter sp. UNC279MFTsu5.1]|uniref:hypothetical protein n=1 Tax=Caulobacter sp. UNC279MFTsu5.1 TaxID=1502775 RepID=UPI0008EF9766|nr:hypothetical protein [Caulobacter sp. UNC279MFTsu5.1]SFJ23336.1 hypothetical protein SAMN02799626_01361 [Caulobacter sp. UNC279MFTsu5.1]